MKIYFIGQKGIPALFGGIERHVEDLATGLAKKGHDVFVYTRKNYTPRELKEYKGVNLISLKNIPSKNLDTITHTIRACFDASKKDADIIHFHSIGPSSLIWLMKILKPGTPIVATFHSKCYLHKKWGFLARAYLRFGERVICKRAHKTITVSRSLEKYAKYKYNSATEYIPNGVYLSSKKEADKIRKWGLEGNDYILAVSRLVAHKGLHYLIDAYKKIDTDKKLVIVGGGIFTNDYVNKLKSLAKDNPNIIFTGNQTEDVLAELYSNAYLFVQPSESEGLSIALLEAMSYENAILASDIPENKEAVGDKNFTFKNKDEKSLEQSLLYLLDNPDLIIKTGIENRKRVSEFYNWDNIVNEVEGLYEGVAGKNPPDPLC